MRPGRRTPLAAIRELGRRAEVLRVDISRDEDVAALAAEVRQRFGRADAWINNAGADILTGAGGRLSAREKLDLVLAVDLRGTIIASWAAVELMRERGGGHRQHVLGSRGLRHGGRESRPLFGGQGRDHELQQVARPAGGAARSG